MLLLFPCLFFPFFSGIQHSNPLLIRLHVCERVAENIQPCGNGRVFVQSLVCLYVNSWSCSLLCVWFIQLYVSFEEGVTDTEIVYIYVPLSGGENINVFTFVMSPFSFICISHNPITVDLVNTTEYCMPVLIENFCP